MILFGNDKKKVYFYFRSDPDPFFHETDSRIRTRIKIKRIRNTDLCTLTFLLWYLHHSWFEQRSCFYNLFCPSVCLYIVSKWHQKSLLSPIRIKIFLLPFVVRWFIDKVFLYFYIAYVPFWTCICLLFFT